jgi:hypothetical protein
MRTESGDVENMARRKRLQERRDTRKRLLQFAGNKSGLPLEHIGQVIFLPSFLSLTAP